MYFVIVPHFLRDVVGTCCAAPECAETTPHLANGCVCLCTKTTQCEKSIDLVSTVSAIDPTECTVMVHVDCDSLRTSSTPRGNQPVNA